VQISTHPSLSLRQDLCLEIPPSATVRQQAITITLPPSHRILTVKPTLIASTAERQTKLVALMGTHRLHSSGDASTLAYDIQLHPGTTKVDLEAIAGPPRGAPKTGPPGSDLDYERVTIFFNLLRWGPLYNILDRNRIPRMGFAWKYQRTCIKQKFCVFFLFSFFSHAV